MFFVWETVCGCLALISVTLSLISISGHLNNFTKPYLQKYVVRILLMVPIYSLNAWIAMLYTPSSIYLDSARECYESFVIYSFMKYLLNFLTYDTNLQQYIDHKPGPVQLFPFCCLPSCVGGRQFMLICKHGILQYVIVRPVSSLAAFASELLGVYGKGELNPLSGYTFPILFLVNNGSQLVAIYSLVMFHFSYKHELAPMRPLYKFLSIKLVIFFSFFQSVVITGLLQIEPIFEASKTLFPEVGDNRNEVADKLQELLICFDMLIAAIAHKFAFPHKPYVSGERNLGSFIDPSFHRSPSNLSFDNISIPVSHSLINLLDTDNNQLEVDNQSDQYRRRTALNIQVERSTSSGSNGYEQISCSQAIWSLFDFKDERADFTETFSDASEKMRLLFKRQGRLPQVVTTSGGTASSSTPTGTANKQPN